MQSAARWLHGSARSWLADWPEVVGCAPERGRYRFGNVRGDSRFLGAAVALVGLAVLLGSAASPVTADTRKKPPKIVYAEFTENPEDESEYRFKVGAVRSKSVVVKLRESPQEGQTTGPTETIPLSKVDGSSSPKQWVGYTSKNRSAPCYRAAYIARNAHGRDSKAYRLCIFGHGGVETLRVSPW